MVATLSRAIEETDTEPHELVFDGLLRLIVAFLPRTYSAVAREQRPLTARYIQRRRRHLRREGAELL